MNYYLSTTNTIIMKIAYFWTGEFSRNILAEILEKNTLEVKLAVSQPDKPFGRKQELIPTPVKQLALEKNLEILQPEKLKNNTEFFDKLTSFELDFIIVVAYGKIIPKEILEIPKYGCINIHGSILPAYRWASPIQESLKNWDTKTWLTIMYMSEWMDEWDVLKVEEINIDILDKTPELFKKFENIWVNLLTSTLKWIVSSEIQWVPQDHSKATYCSKISKEDGKIDFETESVFDIYNKYRAYFPWPGIYSYYEGKKFDITDCFFEENELYFDDDFQLGDVVEFEDHGKNYIWILCKWGILILNKVKLEWKKEMSIKDFINGNKNFLEYNFL